MHNTTKFLSIWILKRDDQNGKYSNVILTTIIYTCQIAIHQGKRRKLRQTDPFQDKDKILQDVFDICLKYNFEKVF